MNKKIIIISIIFIIILIFSIIIFINSINDPNDDIIENDEISPNDISSFLGKWDDLFYSTDKNSYSTWEFYENNSIKNSTTALPYGETEPKTIIQWHEFKLENSLIYLKFEPNSDYLSYKYVFSNSNKHLSIYYDTNDVLDVPFISLNRKSN